MDEECMEINQPILEYEVASSSMIKSKAKRVRKLTSAVWEHFTKDKDENGKLLGTWKCNYCKKSYECNSGHGTTTLKRHLDSQCPKYSHGDRDKKQQLLTFSSSAGSRDGNVLSNWKFDQEFSRKAMARMIIEDELPFKFVEKNGFRQFCKSLQPRFNIVTRATITKDCVDIYMSEREKLESIFQQSVNRISLTTDLCTSNQNQGYLCLTAHYIDIKWKIQKRIICFCILPSPHTGDIIAQSLELGLKSWGIKKICTITVDNASSNDVAIKNFGRRMLKKNALLCCGEYLHVRCAAHIINLIVKDGIDEIKDSIFRIRFAVRNVKSSPSRLQKFKMCTEEEEITCQHSLCLDVPTRWNSTYLMLESALKYQKTFDCLADKDNVFRSNSPPTDEDWENARIICKFLEKFYHITTRVSGSLYCTSNIYFVEVCKIERLLLSLQKSSDVNLRQMSIKMKDKFDKYWGTFEKMNILLIIAVVLDPRYKLGYVEWCYEMSHGLEKALEISPKVKEKLYELYTVYKTELCETVSKGDSIDKVDEVNMNSDDVGEDDAWYQCDWFSKREHSKTEVDQYLEEASVGRAPGFDILAWWSKNKDYKILSHLARDILAIPVSTVASKSAFSTGGRVLDQFRSSLTPRLVEILVCAQDWIKASPQSLGVEENLTEIEATESTITISVNLKTSIDFLHQLDLN